MKNFRLLMMTLLFLMGQHSFARVGAGRIGTEGGNGGDLCEAGIYEIRNDIAAWIRSGGAQGLKFSAAVNADKYALQMLASMSIAKVSCVDATLKIGQAEKTCVNTTSEGESRIQCNIQRLAALSASDKYVLIHHEYAGAAGLEVNDGEASQYDISNQLTGFLQQSIVTKLVLKPAVGGNDLMLCRDNYISAFSATEENGTILLRFQAIGFSDRLELADKFGLPEEKKFSVLEVGVPTQNCAWATQGRLSCSGYDPVLVFKNSQGETQTIKAFKFSLRTGEVGAGTSAYRRVELSIEKDRNEITDVKGYRVCSGVLAQ